MKLKPLGGRSLPIAPALDRLFSAIAPLGISREGRRPRFAVGPPPRGGPVLIAPGGARDAKRWGSDRFAEVARRLAEKLLPETANACHLRAIAAGTLKETVRWLSEGLELQPRHYPSIRARALMYYALKDYARMETDAGSLILVRPEAPLGYALRAVARRESGRIEDALRDHDRAIQLAADDAELYAQRRETHLRKADFERALADARRCVELRPEQPTYRYHVFSELAALGGLIVHALVYFALRFLIKREQELTQSHA